MSKIILIKKKYLKKKKMLKIITFVKIKFPQTFTKIVRTMRTIEFLETF